MVIHFRKALRLKASTKSHMFCSYVMFFPLQLCDQAAEKTCRKLIRQNVMKTPVNKQHKRKTTICVDSSHLPLHSSWFSVSSTSTHHTEPKIDSHRPRPRSLQVSHRGDGHTALRQRQRAQLTEIRHGLHRAHHGILRRSRPVWWSRPVLSYLEMQLWLAWMGTYQDHPMGVLARLPYVNRSPNRAPGQEVLGSDVVLKTCETLSTCQVSIPMFR